MIGFVGQGYVGKNMADAIEERGHTVIRYSLEPEYIGNKDAIKECEIVFIAVPTPTVNGGQFDDSIVAEALHLVGDDKIAVIKSTVLPGTTDELQRLHPTKFVMFSPEFLTEKTAAADVRKPDRNVIGCTRQSYRRAGEVLAVLPPAPFEKIAEANAAELAKYGGNCWFYVKIMLMNTLAEVCASNEIDFNQVKEIMGGDPRIGRTHLEVEHQGGRGAGGHCFIKDFAAYKKMFEMTTASSVSQAGLAFLEAAEHFNLALLTMTEKDAELVKGVYH